MRFLSRLSFATVTAASLASCDGADVTVNPDGVPLDEIEQGGTPPSELVLAGSDTVLIEEGDAFAIRVEGSEQAVSRLRFERDGDQLLIAQQSEDGNWLRDDAATIRVTMTAPTEITMAGSGRIRSFGTARTAQINIAGSGNIEVDRVGAEKLGVNIGGSGDVGAAGATQRLELNIAGSGSGDLAEVTVGEAKVNIIGSGDGRFDSNGSVTAKIVGSGAVAVTGSARCSVNSLGSGSLTCNGRKVQE